LPVERPTFSESWYRVGELSPRLRATVQIHRQFFRGQTWHVLQDPASNQFFRLNEPAYRFVGLMDGRRSVAEIWKITNAELGDSAPTQGEVIQLLGQLYTSNLLAGDMPPDAAGLFKRHRQRVTREVQSYLMNLLFIRIPLFDPDRLLDRTVGLFGRLFTWYGLVLWAGLMLVAAYFVAGRADELQSGAKGILEPARLPLLYAALVIVKVCHEFGHSYACKKFGRDTGGGGEVHILGVMFLVFTPLPYVDASSSLALRDKWHRAIVGAAGMMVELGLAAVAAVVWAKTGEGSPIHSVAYNVVFIGSVSTLLFNGNPLLRYDGYYILSDLLEIPNLAQRSKEYVYYLVKKYVWSVKQARNPAHTPGEKVWMVLYGISSSIYRVFISVVILLFVTDAIPVLGAVLAVTAVVAWGLVPIGKFVHYLASNGELIRVRTRAVLTSLAAPAAIIALTGFIPLPDRFYVEGVVRPVRMTVIHSGADGFLVSCLPSGQAVTAGPDGPVLAQLDNEPLRRHQERNEAELREFTARLHYAMVDEAVAVQIRQRQVDAVREKIRRADEQLADLAVRSPQAGQWISADIDLKKGSYIKRGDKLGLVATMDDLEIQAEAVQNVAGVLQTSALPDVRMRIIGRPDQEFSGRIKEFLPAGQEHTPPQLGAPVGGQIAIMTDDRSGTKAAERIFEIQVTPEPESLIRTRTVDGQSVDDSIRLMPEQRVLIRFDTPSKPLMEQGWRWLLQLLQKRFHI